MENFESTTLKAFKTTQKNLAMMGISRKLATQSYPFNGRIFMYYYAQTFVEYTQCIFMGSAAMLTIFLLTVQIFKVKKLFEFINRCECMLNTRK